MKRTFLPIAALLFLTIIISRNTVLSAPGDTTHVITHNQVTVVTNPSAGNNPYPAWGAFPPNSVQYRKVTAHLTVKCPPGMACGEWDYLDFIKLRRKGGVDSADMNMEIVRFITPYGNSFGSTWNSTYHIDITDYQLLLHDSVEIEYNHGGYETNVGKGWLITIDFALIEGQPVMEPIAITPLWNGSFPYGNAANPIENYLIPVNLNMDANTSLLRIRIHQTGHGADASNCAEFCQRTRTFKFDGATANTKNIWRLCGTNPVFPQGGTWIYNRSNWCPGALSNPDIYDFSVTGGSSHTVDADMTPYTTASPSANYVFGSHAIEYKAPVFTDDASIEEVYYPNSIFEYSRMNPVCDNAKVQLRNNGTSNLTSAVIKYGLTGSPFMSTFNWSGTLQPNKTTDVTLGDYIIPATGNQTFTAYLESVNGIADQYPHDDTIYSNALIPQEFDSVIVFHYKTNSIPSQTYYRVYNHNNQIIYQVLAGTLTANTVYRDTFYLSAGCYRFTLYDSGGDGLSFWANPGQGTGYARFQKLSGLIVKTFLADFGSEISHNWVVDPGNIVGVNENSNPGISISVFPNPASENLFIEIPVSSLQDIRISLYNSTGLLVLEKNIRGFFNEMVEISLSGISPGIYVARIVSDELNVTKKVVVQK